MDLGGTLTIDGTFNSIASEFFTLEFFAGTAGDASGYGEGERVLGTTNVTTDQSGDVSFSVPFTGVAAGDVVVATATDQDGNTSEFSGSISVTASLVDLAAAPGVAWVGDRDRQLGLAPQRPTTFCNSNHRLNLSRTAAADRRLLSSPC